MRYSIDSLEYKVVAEGQWPKSKYKALQESIFKYKWLINWLKLHPQLSVPYLDTDSCALCYRYYKDGDCLGCLVSFATGQTDCHHTPFDEYKKAQKEQNKARAIESAEAELKFLESLTIFVKPPKIKDNR